MVTYELHSPVVLAHVAAALLALVLGTTILLRRKGTFSHKTMGWIWAVLMASVAFSAIPLRTYKGIPNIDGFTPIHLFILLVLFNVPRAVWAIYRGDARTHGKAMRGLYYGALLGAGVFTLLPNRLLGHLLWHNLFGLG